MCWWGLWEKLLQIKTNQVALSGRAEAQNIYTPWMHRTAPAMNQKEGEKQIE
jgi:hypothetical protein